MTPQVQDLWPLAAQHIAVFVDPKQKIFENGDSEGFILDKLGLRTCYATLLGAYRNTLYVAQLASYFFDDGRKGIQNLVKKNTEKKVRKNLWALWSTIFKRKYTGYPKLSASGRS